MMKIKNRADLACFAVIFFGTGLAMGSSIDIGFDTPVYVYVIRDTLGLILCIIGVYFASEWVKRGRQESEMEEQDSMRGPLLDAKNLDIEYNREDRGNTSIS